MSTIASTSDSSDASDQTPRPPADGSERTRVAAAAPRRRLLDRIAEAVRAAHAASVPF